MEQQKTPIRCLACSIFRNIIEECISKDAPSVKFEFLTSMLHMYPEILNKKLDEKLKLYDLPNERIILMYGDCHAYMHEMESREGVHRIKGINCIEILLEESQYKKLRKEGAFFLMPEWTLRWKEVFQNELGLGESLGKDFFREFHSKLVYLDTGQIAIPEIKLKEVSEYTGLPCEIVKVNKQIIAGKINKILESI